MPALTIGYARVSTALQDPALQLDALNRAECDRIYTEHVSGAKAARPELARALEQLRAGDTLLVWRLDRLGRSLSELIAIANDLAGRGVGLRSLQESIDTTSASGTFVFHLFCALAEFDRAVTLERTHAGLTAARARGRAGGRPRKMTAAKRAAPQTMYDSREHTVDEIAAAIAVSRATLYRSLDRRADATPAAA